MTIEQWQANPPSVEELNNPVYPITSQPSKLTRFRLAYDRKDPFEYVSVSSFDVWPQAQDFRTVSPWLHQMVPSSNPLPLEVEQPNLNPSHSRAALYSFADWGVEGLYDRNRS